jgi:hypothetical protein
MKNEKPKRTHCHIQLNDDLNEAVRLLAFIERVSRDDKINEMLIREIPSEIEALLENDEEKINPFKTFIDQLENFRVKFERAEMENRK